MTRPGFMIYNEDGKMLLYLDVDTRDKIVINLINLSVNMDETGEIPSLDCENGLAKALYDNMVEKVVRDDSKYKDKARQNAIIAKAAAIMRETKANGVKKTKEQAYIEAEQWVDGRTQANASEREQTQANCNSNSSSNLNVSVASSLTTSLSVPPPVSSSVTPSVSQQQAIEAVERQGIRVNSDIRKIIADECKDKSIEEFNTKLLTDLGFRQRLKMIGG